MKTFITTIAIVLSFITVYAQNGVPVSAQKSAVISPGAIAPETVVTDSVSVQSSQVKGEKLSTGPAKKEENTAADGVKSDAVKKPD